MNRFVRSRSAWLVAMAACAVGVPQMAAAAEGSEDSLSLKIANALRPDRFFVRAGAIGVHIKTKSGDTRDVSGPVVTLDELQNIFTQPATVYIDPRLAQPVNLLVADPQYDEAANLTYLFDRTLPSQNPDPNDPQRYGIGTLMDARFGIPLLTQYMVNNGIDGLGTPAGIKGEAKNSAGTGGISLGYWLDDDHKWVVEGYVLAAPVSASVTVKGTTARLNEGGPVLSTPNIRPIGISGARNLITTKLVPPLLMLGRYWGDKDAKFRPYTGAIAMYAIFTNTKASDVLNTYVGGSNPGDTSVSIKNTFGMGPMVGFKYQLSDEWHASFNLGYVQLKTVATLTTRNTMITSNSAVVADLGAVSDKITEGEFSYNTSTNQCIERTTCEIVVNNGGLVSMITKGIIAERYANGTGPGDGKTLGTYVRKTDTTLSNTMFMLSVGRSF